MESNNWVSQEVLDKVINSNKFNGIVYGERRGNYTVFGIYLDGKYVNICRDKMNPSRTKKEIETELSVVGLKSEKINENTNVLNTSSNTEKSEWLVNGDKIVRNNLSYGEMWEKYGTDFE